MILLVVGMSYGWSAVPAFAAPTSLRFMHGTWTSGDYALHLDMERMLANLDREKPFQRDALIIRNITDAMVVFSTGGRQFIGLFAGDLLTLTGDGLPGAIELRRRSLGRAKVSR